MVLTALADKSWRSLKSTPRMALSSSGSPLSRVPVPAGKGGEQMGSSRSGLPPTLGCVARMCVSACARFLQLSRSAARLHFGLAAHGGVRAADGHNLAAELHLRVRPWWRERVASAGSAPISNRDTLKAHDSAWRSQRPAQGCRRACSVLHHAVHTQHSESSARASSVTTRTPGSTSRLERQVASFHSGAPTPAKVASYMRARSAEMTGTFTVLSPEAAAQVARPQRAAACTRRGETRAQRTRPRCAAQRAPSRVRAA
jgi:hypothetical protein